MRGIRDVLLWGSFFLFGVSVGVWLSNFLWVGGRPCLKCSLLFMFESVMMFEDHDCFRSSVALFRVGLDALAHSSAHWKLLGTYDGAAHYLSSVFFFCFVLHLA